MTTYYVRVAAYAAACARLNWSAAPNSKRQGYAKGKVKPAKRTGAQGGKRR